MWFKMVSNFGIFQQLDREFEQDADFKDIAHRTTYFPFS